MGSGPNGHAAEGTSAGASAVTPFRHDWRLAREAHSDLQIARPRRTNLLLVGPPGATRIVLDMLELGVREPLQTWRPGHPLELPQPGRAATLVLHDVDRLTPSDQEALLRWLDRTAAIVRVVSTAAEPMWSRVREGGFSEVLYYRLNTVCLTVAAPQS